MINRPLKDLLLIDGPFMPGGRLWRENLNLLLALMPFAATAVWVHGTIFILKPLVALAGAFLATLLFGINRRERLSDLDWAVAAILTLAWPLPAYWSAAAGFAAAALPFLLKQRIKILNIPQGAALITIAAAVMIIWVSQKGAVPQLNGPFSRLETVALGLGGLSYIWPKPCFRRIFIIFAFFLIVPGGLVYLFDKINYSPIFSDLSNILHPLPTAFLAFFIMPRLAASAKYSPNAYLMIAAAALFSVCPETVPLLVFSLWFSEFRKRPKNAEKKLPKTETSQESALKIFINCAHQGQAARLTANLDILSCGTAALNDGGALDCPYGCLGGGDCVRACPFGALRLNENGFPVLETKLCRGCGLCLKICPKNLISLKPENKQAFIACASRSSLKKNVAYCPAGCLGCGLCRKACPAGAIPRNPSGGALAIDQNICIAYGHGCGQVCAKVCPRSNIVLNDV